MNSLPQSSVMLAETSAKSAHRLVRVLIGLSSPMECQLLMSAAKRAERHFDVVACAVSKHEIVRCISRGNVDVALINSHLEDGRLAGLQVLPEIHDTQQKTSIVVLFDAWQDDLIVQAFRSGAKGVFCRLEKNLDMLWKCISAVHEGQVWANSEQLRLLLNAMRAAAPVRTLSPRALNLLAARETQVAELVSEGLQNKDIAGRLGISEHTVSNYLFRIYNKLGISNRVELVLYMKEREGRAAPIQQPEQ